MTTPAFGGWAVNPLLDQPAGTLGATMARGLITATLGVLTSGTPIVRGIPLPAGIPVTNITVNSGSTAEAGGTHAWVALLEPGGSVVAVSADNTGAAFFAASTPKVIPVFGPAPGLTPYITPGGGLYYVQLCVVATTMPTFVGQASLPAGVAGTAPVLMGTTTAGQTTPPALGSVQAIASNGGFNLYAAVS